MYVVGQTLKLERNPIYAGSQSGARLQESERTISRVEFSHGRIRIQFEGSKISVSSVILPSGQEYQSENSFGPKSSWV